MGRQDRAGSGSDDDEEHWQRKEARRLVRDKAALNPLTLGAPHFILLWCSASTCYVFRIFATSERGAQSAVDGQIAPSAFNHTSNNKAISSAGQGAVVRCCVKI